MMSILKFGYPCFTLGRGPSLNPTTPEDLESMISYRLVSHLKYLGTIISEIEALLSLTKISCVSYLQVGTVDEEP